MQNMHRNYILIQIIEYKNLQITQCYVYSIVQLCKNICSCLEHIYIEILTKHARIYY